MFPIVGFFKDMFCGSLLWFWLYCQQMAPNFHSSNSYHSFVTYSLVPLLAIYYFSVMPIKNAAVKSLQSCLTLCDPIDGSPPGSPVPGILQARILEWVVISFSNAWMWKVKVKSLSRVRLLVTPWTAAYQAPLPMGFSRQEYWSWVPLPSPNKE